MQKRAIDMRNWRLRKHTERKFRGRKKENNGKGNIGQLTLMTGMPRKNNNKMQFDRSLVTGLLLF